VNVETFLLKTIIFNIEIEHKIDTTDSHPIRQKMRGTPLEFEKTYLSYICTGRFSAKSVESDRD
jgi:hypothetical protein